jgi:catechol 2,3-dioxygenase-like lactoylglutathione lyase family enzyme
VVSWKIGHPTQLISANKNMNIIPVLACKDMKESLGFYVSTLDFTLVGTWPEMGSPSFSILLREGAELHLSTYPGDGVTGSIAAIIINDIESLFQKFVSRGLQPGKLGSPVHLRPTLQSWGTTEFYVDDHSGNTLRFIQRS